MQSLCARTHAQHTRMPANLARPLWTAPRLRVPKVAIELPSTLAESIESGLILDHGRLQAIDSSGAIVPDQSGFQGGKWHAALEHAPWARAPVIDVPSARVVSVYGRGSIPRGLALDGISDVDTIGYVTIPGSASTKAAAAKWRARAQERATLLRATFPFATGLEMKLILVSEDAPLGQFLSAVADGSDAPAAAAMTLDEAQLVELDAFRVASQGLLLGGCDLVKHFPPPKPQPRLALTLRQDLSRAARAVAATMAEEEDGPLAYARWAAKRVLRSGMELAASSGGYDGFSRDLLPCHRAIVATVPSARAQRLSLKLLQLCCAPGDAVKELGGGAAVALELLGASKLLSDDLEGILLSAHFQRPLLDFAHLPEPPPLPATAAADVDDLRRNPSPPPLLMAAASTSLRRAKMRLTSSFWRASMIARSAVPAAPDASRVVSDPLPPLTLGLDRNDRRGGYPVRGARVLDLDWCVAAADARAASMDRAARSARRPARAAPSSSVAPPPTLRR